MASAECEPIMGSEGIASNFQWPLLPPLFCCKDFACWRPGMPYSIPCRVRLRQFFTGDFVNAVVNLHIQPVHGYPVLGNSRGGFKRGYRLTNNLCGILSGGILSPWHYVRVAFCPWFSSTDPNHHPKRNPDPISHFATIHFPQWGLCGVVILCREG